MSEHKCPMPECTTQVPSRKLACRQHWLELPAELRHEVNASYRDKTPTGRNRHASAVRAAYRWYVQQTDLSIRIDDL